MSVAAISISPAASGAAAAPKASGAKGFDSVMSGASHADAAPKDDADTRVATKDDQDDTDRKDKDIPAKDAGEDPAALIALANSVAAITRGDAAADATAKVATDKAAAAVSATAIALTPSTTPADATAQPAPSAAADTPPDATALALAPSGAAQQPQPNAGKAAKPTQKTMIGADTSVSTADILAARSAKVAPVDATKDDGKDPTDAGDDSGTSSPDPTPAITTIASTSTTTDVAVTATGGETLAVGAADRQLDLAKGDAWLDGLARDIASTADTGGTLRFQLSPQTLGNLHVELTRGDDGTAVKMTTATVDAQAILADARPRLIESARAHGVHISDATIDVGSAGTATSDQQRDFSGNGGNAQSQSNTGSANAGGDANRQAQSQPQNEPDLYHGARRPDAIASASTGGSRRDLDAGYA